MMKTRNLIGMIAFCLFALAACTPSKESEKTLTVLSWNVWQLIPKRDVRELSIF